MVILIKIIKKRRRKMMIDEEERKGWSTISVLFICIWIVVSFYIIFIIIPYAVFILTLTNNIKLVVLFYIIERLV